MFQVWFQNRRAKFRKQERLAQQKASQGSGTNGGSGGASTPGSDGGQPQQSSTPGVKTEPKSGGGGNTPKDVKPSPVQNNVSQHTADVKPLNGNGKITLTAFKVTSNGCHGYDSFY